jgi:DNA-binding beta-propeller fold protein YncE
MRIPAAPISRRTRRCLAAGLAASALALGLAGPAWAGRTLLTTGAVQGGLVPPLGKKGICQATAGCGIEGPCGIAIGSGLIYVSDYYHHAVDVFSSGGAYLQQQILGDPLDGPCGLASAPGGVLYANDWHEGASRLLPSRLDFDSAESTGVAVDQGSGDVYVDDRTYVAVYEDPIAPGEEPAAKIGLGSLQDGYGVAVAAGRVYVPDAADNTVKVYEPAADLANPVAVIDGAATPQQTFRSLADSAAAIDLTNGHLLVLDNLQPGFEHPEAAIDEFDSDGSFLAQLGGRPGERMGHGEPSGLAVDGSGALYVTSGNSEKGTVFKFGPYAAAAAPLDTAAVPASPGPSVAGARPGLVSPAGAAKRGTASASEVVQRAGLRVSFDGKLTPKALPRTGSAPARVSVAARIAPSDGGALQQLRKIVIAINRYGHFEPQGLPVCSLREIQPSNTANALKACRASLVGKGSFSADVALGQQAPFPAAGKLYAFNGTLDGHPAILAHVYGTDPVPTSFTLAFELSPARGTFGTVLRASLPEVTGSSGYITGISLNLGRSFRSHGRTHSYLSASCPAPRGFPGAVFPFARASFGFAGRTIVTSTLTRSCGVRGTR